VCLNARRAENESAGALAGIDPSAATHRRRRRRVVMTPDHSPVPARRFGSPPVEPGERYDDDDDELGEPREELSGRDLATPRPAGAASRGRVSWERLRRPWIAGPLAAVVAFGVWWFGFRSSGDNSTTVATTTTHQLVTVTRGNLTNTVSAEGTVAAAQTDDLSFTAAGTVTAVNVQAGQQVTAGQVLATINSPSLQSAVSSAASTLAKAQASLSDDESSGASSEQIAADQTSVQTAGDSLARAWQGLAGSQLVATFNGTVSSVNLTVGEQLSSSGSGGTTPTGSGSGSGQSSSTLGNGNGNGNGNGSGSGSSSAQIEVVSAGSYTVQLPVSSSDVDGIKVGDPATLTVTTSSANGFGGFGGGGFARFFGLGGRGVGTGSAGTGNAGNGNAGTGNAGSGRTGTGGAGATPVASVTGTVTTVGKVASASSGVAQYPVTVTFATDNTGISIGTTVTGAISTSVVNDVLQIPLRAVTTTNGKSTVQVALDGKANGRTETRTVQTGQSAGGMIVITSGLKEGDQVAVTTVVPKAVTQTGGNGNPFTGRGGNGGRFFGGGAGTGGGGTGGTGAPTGG
jgi:multidrug efflux pump subunit AcrA (membrane-fusion protein)